MRESAKHAAAFTLQSEHIKQLHNTVETGNAVLLGHMNNSALLAPAAVFQKQQNSLDRAGAARPSRSKRDRSYRFRVSLPRWFVNCVWELGVHEADGVWTTQIWPVNVRPDCAVVFEYVRSGDVEAVRELLKSRQLSLRDHMRRWDGDLSLFEVTSLDRTRLRWPSKLTFAGGSHRRPTRALPISATRELSIPSRRYHKRRA